MEKNKLLKKQLRYLLFLKANINKEISLLKNNNIFSNIPILKYELECLDEGIGRDYLEGDYYAPSRIYSSIGGVKNIRVNWGDKEIGIKITNNLGKLFPEFVIYKKNKYKIYYIYSKNFSKWGRN